MTVVSRVLYGKLQICSFDLVPIEKAQTLSFYEPGNLYGALCDETVLSAPCTTALSPHCGNIHEFLADDVTGCAIFDVLTPPYNAEAGRDCTYYKRIGSRIEQDGRIFVPLEQCVPNNLVVRSAPYRGPEII